ncbi:MAG: single-stranded DNA-binding protein [Rickettsiales bacterium]|nr:single-stranded DNA-binding protein [Rickettsiales bacterium]|tara:strand:+ start:31 stop:495 length:465 start_codon:yes stop_codon:yes gene_type:complete
MAGSINKAILLGRLGGDPEIRVSQDGNKIARLSLATTDNWKDKETNERKEKTEWHRVVIFSKGLAEIAEKYLKKGSLIYVEGQIKSRKYTDQSGMEKYTTEVVLQQYNSSLTMLDNKSDNVNNLESPNIENSIKDESKFDSKAGNFDIEDEVPF